jgi:hypothetical protein
MVWTEGRGVGGVLNGLHVVGMMVLRSVKEGFLCCGFPILGSRVPSREESGRKFF